MGAGGPELSLVHARSASRSGCSPAAAPGPAAAAAVSRTPGGHPEGYLEGFANIYLGAAQAIRAAQAGSRAEVLDLLPGLDAGMAGMRFISAAIRSSKADAAWTAP